MQNVTFSGMRMGYNHLIYSNGNLILNNVNFSDIYCHGHVIHIENTNQSLSYEKGNINNLNTGFQLGYGSLSGFLYAKNALGIHMSDIKVECIVQTQNTENIFSFVDVQEITFERIKFYYNYSPSSIINIKNSLPSDKNSNYSTVALSDLEFTNNTSALIVIDGYYNLEIRNAFFSNNLCEKNLLDFKGNLKLINQKILLENTIARGNYAYDIINIENVNELSINDLDIVKNGFLINSFETTFKKIQIQTNYEFSEYPNIQIESAGYFIHCSKITNSMFNNINITQNQLKSTSDYIIVSIASLGQADNMCEINGLHLQNFIGKVKFESVSNIKLSNIEVEKSAPLNNPLIEIISSNKSTIQITKANF